MITGKIYRAIGGVYYVQSNKGMYECRARGKLRLGEKIPLVGDIVEFKPTDTGRGVLTEILPRSNEFIRPPIANIDSMVIIVSAAIPVTDPYLIDRMTVIAKKSNCKSIICINKYDIDRAKELFRIYNSSGFVTIRTSAVTGYGISELIDSIRNTTCAFTGNSGVGKSSILNSIDPDFNISVGEISKKLGRGRHTTRHVELYKLSCGALVADTPGFSSFDMDYIAAKEEIQYLFDDLSPYLSGCRFYDCAHIKEPECSVIDAVKAGKIQQSRYNSYVRLYEQASGINPWDLEK